MTSKEFHEQSQQGVDTILQAVVEVMKRLPDRAAFEHITNEIYITNRLSDSGRLIMSGGYAEALMRLAKLATPASLPATTLAE
jgi:hypothetical protein